MTHPGYIGKTYDARGATCPHGIARQPLTLMSEKRTNPLLSADVTTTSSPSPTRARWPVGGAIKGLEEFALALEYAY